MKKAILALCLTALFAGCSSSGSIGSIGGFGGNFGAGNGGAGISLGTGLSF